MTRALVALVAICFASALAQEPAGPQQWLEKGLALVQNNMSNQAKLGKEVVEWIASAAQSGISIGSAATQTGTAIGSDTMDKVNSLVKEILAQSTTIANNGIDVAQAAADLTPAGVADLIKKVLEASKTTVSGATGATTQIVDKTSQGVKGILNWLGSQAAAGQTTLGERLNQGKDRIQQGIDKALQQGNSLVDRIGQALKPKPAAAAAA